jgi:hypothetical protein
MPGAQSVRTITIIQRIQPPPASTETANNKNLKMNVFQNTVPFGLVETSQHFTVAYCPHHQDVDLMMEAASTSETSVSLF